MLLYAILDINKKELLPFVLRPCRNILDPLMMYLLVTRLLLKFVIVYV